jgi:hypothetical protein
MDIFNLHFRILHSQLSRMQFLVDTYYLQFSSTSSIYSMYNINDARRYRRSNSNLCSSWYNGCLVTFALISLLTAQFPVCWTFFWWLFWSSWLPLTKRISDSLYCFRSLCLSFNERCDRGTSWLFMSENVTLLVYSLGSDKTPPPAVLLLRSIGSLVRWRNDVFTLPFPRNGRCRSIGRSVSRTLSVTSCCIEGNSFQRVLTLVYNAQNHWVRGLC